MDWSEDRPGRGGEDSAAATLEHLLSASLDRLAERPPIDAPGGVPLDGYGHLPFAAWLVAALRPALTVGITSRRPAFHAAICQSLIRERVPGEAVAIEVAHSERSEHGLDRPFAAVARRVRLASWAEGLPLADASVTLIHADADLWQASGSRWRRTLSPGAVLVLHGVEPGEQSGESAFVFTHDGGLRVEAVGSGSPALLALWRIAANGGAPLAAVRGRFAWLGERWRQEALAVAHKSARDDAEVGGRERLVDALRERSRLETEVRRVPVLNAERAEATRRAADLEQLLARSEAARLELERRLSEATERGRGWLRKRSDAPVAPPPPVAVGSTRSSRKIGSVLFVAGEPDTAGAEFRARRQALACAATGRRGRWVRIDEVGLATLEGVDLLVLWRAPWTQHVETMVGIARGAGARIAFDVDDLVVEPSLARPAVIDGMRTMWINEAHLSHYFQQLRSTLEAADFAIATTEELASQLRFIHPAVYVVPNSFDDAAHDTTRLERRARRIVLGEADGEARGDGLLRIGYAAGTQSHQRDFRVAASAIAEVLRTREQVRLVLFRGERGEMLVASEFPELAGLADRIEWRDMVPVERLAAEVARFDIAICPIETGNVFCECKSEIKYIESALAGVPCVASPTGPFARAISHGRNGLLAADAAAWREALLKLLDEPETRERIGFAAYCDVLWRFGPRRVSELWDGLLRGLEGPREAAEQHELRIRRGASDGFGVPILPPTEILFEHDTLRVAEVTVAITSFDYEGYLEEALESVAAQTLDAIELVVVDDCSRDASAAKIVAWARAHRRRFTRIRVERTRFNSGLGAARNAAFAASESRYVMSLDADNRLLPDCCALLLALVVREGAAFAYPALRLFGDPSPAISSAPYDPVRLIPGNYIDAMALVAKWAWAAAGGYYDRADARGWEDFGLWCRLAELGQFGVWHPGELAEYRVHAGSMTNAVTETEVNKRALVAFTEERHPWLRLRSRKSDLR